MLAAIKKEISLKTNFLPEKETLQTIYFGGGTPSVLSINELAELLATIKQCFTIESDAEITIEANPDDLSDEYLAALQRLGFNRLSIGIQSFFDDDLKWMNRRHSAEEAMQSVRKAQKHGFGNINIDLLYGLPSMNNERWRRNLQYALELQIPHISAYHLSIEPRTVFGKRQAKGKMYTVSEEASVAQFDILLDTLQAAGYEHYEISNFARRGFRSSHNCSYWLQKPYIGVGPSAHSFDGKTRQWNINNNSRYIAALEAEDTWFESEHLTVAEQYNDYILVSLRTVWGVSIRYISEQFGKTFEEYFLEQVAGNVHQGYIQEQNGIYSLSRKGKLICDRLSSDLFYVL